MRLWLGISTIFYINKIVRLTYSGFCCFFLSQEETGVPCTPLRALMVHLCTVGRLFMWWSMVLGCCVVGTGVAEGGG